MAIETSNDPRAFTDFEHQGWETTASGYDQHFTQLTRQSSSAVLDAANVRGGMRVLDVCTGPGVIAIPTVERGAEVTGIDFSAEVIRQARNNLPVAEFQEADAMALPFDANSFDAVVCGYGIIHVPDPQKALLEMYRVIKPGGRVAVSVWEHPKPGNGFGLLFASIKAHGDLNVPLPHGPDFFQFSKNGRLAEALQNIGLSETSILSVEQTWELSDPMGIINAFMEGAVRARGLLMAQTESVREAIFEAVATGMEKFKSSNGHYQVPMPALVGSGKK